MAPKNKPDPDAPYFINMMRILILILVIIIGYYMYILTSYQAGHIPRDQREPEENDEPGNVIQWGQILPVPQEAHISRDQREPEEHDEQVEMLHEPQQEEGEPGELGYQNPRRNWWERVMTLAQREEELNRRDIETARREQELYQRERQTAARERELNILRGEIASQRQQQQQQELRRRESQAARQEQHIRHQNNTIKKKNERIAELERDMAKWRIARVANQQGSANQNPQHARGLALRGNSVHLAQQPHVVPPTQIPPTSSDQGASYEAEDHGQPTENVDFMREESPADLDEDSSQATGSDDLAATPSPNTSPSEECPADNPACRNKDELDDEEERIWRQGSEHKEME